MYIQTKKKKKTEANNILINKYKTEVLKIIEKDLYRKN